jgi:hypothetical protein
LSVVKVGNVSARRLTYDTSTIETKKTPIASPDSDSNATGIHHQTVFSLCGCYVDALGAIVCPLSLERVVGSTGLGSLHGLSKQYPASKNPLLLPV